MTVVNADDMVRLRRAAREKLQGAEVLEARLVQSDRRELRYVIAWRRAKAAYQPGDGNGWTYGTHVALLARDDERALLLWGHYDIGQESDALADVAAR